MTDDKGPYFHRCGTVGERCNCKLCAYEEVFAAGRASRDGLRRALDTIRLWPFDIVGDCVKDARHIASKALEADDKCAK